MAGEARAGTGHGLLLVRRPPAAVGRWLRRGLVASTMAPFGRWTAVTVAEDLARSAEPYDVALEVLAARPAPRRGKPAIGFFDVHDRATITLQASGLRAPQRWLVWQPGVGVVETPSLPRLGIPSLVAAAGAGGRTSPEEVGAVLRSTEGTALDVLVTVLGLLGLPGHDLLVRGDCAGASDVEPASRGVLMFDRLMADEAQHRADWESAWGGRPPGGAGEPR